jgi:hypothetical protein
MGKRIFISAAIILILALLALLAYNNLEIYENKVYSPPSREIRANNYYAMEKWLKETGHPVRIEKQFTPAKISAIPEKTAVIFATACEWEDAESYFIPWIKQGNSLVICMDYNFGHEIDKNLMEFLSSYGIEAGDDSENPEADFFHHFYIKINNDINNDIPKFKIDEPDSDVMLAMVLFKEGTLAVTGYPLFMQNRYLDKKVNAYWSWKLTGESAEENGGVLFVREREIEKSMFGKIMERGNLVPLGVSIFLVIILGFWMVIPVFGPVIEGKQKNSRPIRERFAAEISFLKKYKSLDYYIETNGRELQLEKNYSYREIINKLRRMYDGTDKFKRRIGGIKT